MKDYIEERAVEIANYIIETKATVRQAAKKFGISKSTVQIDVTKEVFFVSKGHRKPETYRANLCDQHKFCASRSVLL